jgi:superfamily I DNA/RNA helicase
MGTESFPGLLDVERHWSLSRKPLFLFKYNSNIKSILFVCFNITLVNYIQRLLAFKGLPLGEKGVHVTHFYQLCADIIKEPVDHENEQADYYDLIIQSTLEQLETHCPQYDAVLVDEGQDFSADMLKVITRVLNPKTDNLTIALDRNQNLYHQDFSWSDVGINALGRVHNLSYVYRSTEQLSRFAADFRSGVPVKNLGKDAHEQKALFPDFFDFTGPIPQLVQLAHFQGICEFVAEKIIEIVETDECPLSEIAVLYVKKTPPDCCVNTVPEMIEEALSAKGIFSQWVSKNYQNKKTYDITTNSVAISTIHSAKGFDYASVFLIGLDTLDDTFVPSEQIEQLTYVGITRARYSLYIPFIEKTPVIEKMQYLIGGK